MLESPLTFHNSVHLQAARGWEPIPTYEILLRHLLSRITLLDSFATATLHADSPLLNDYWHLRKLRLIVTYELSSKSYGTRNYTQGPTITEGTANHPQNKKTKVKEDVAKAFQQEVVKDTPIPLRGLNELC